MLLDAGSRLARGGRKLPKAPKAIQAGAVPKIETADRGGGPLVSCGMPRQRRCAEGLSGTAWATQRQRRYGKREVGELKRLSGWKGKIDALVVRRSMFVLVVVGTRVDSYLARTFVTVW